MSKGNSQPRLGTYFRNRQEPGEPGLPTLSVTMRDGLMRREELERKMDTTLSPAEHLRVRPGDIAYNMMRMWQGACGVADRDAMVSPAYVVLQPTEQIDSRFAFHWFKSPRMLHLLWAYSHGITDDRLRLYYADFASIPVTPPPLPEQRRIAAVLDAWDEAIATTERLIAAKRRRLLAVRKTVLLDLTDTEVPLSDLAEISTGIPAPQDRGAFAESGPRFVRVSDLAAFAGEQPDEPEYLDPGFARTARLRLFPEGTVLFAKSGMSATLARVLRLPVPAHVVSHLGAVNARDSAHQSFLYHWLTEHPPSSLLQGDGFPSIRISEVGSLPIPNVGANRAAEIGEMLDMFEDDIKRERQRGDCLRVQKRGLIQKLLTGELRVPASADALMPGGRLVREAAE